MPVQTIPDHIASTVARNVINNDNWVIATVDQHDEAMMTTQEEPRIMVRGMPAGTIRRVALALFREAQRMDTNHKKQKTRTL
jgi:hypothetical protein